jgi:hypothetical protein
MKTVELYARVRHAVLIEGISERAAADRFGINARTVSKMLKFSVPPGYVRSPSARTDPIGVLKRNSAVAANCSFCAGEGFRDVALDSNIDKL